MIFLGSPKTTGQTEGASSYGRTCADLSCVLAALPGQAPAIGGRRGQARAVKPSGHDELGQHHEHLLNKGHDWFWSVHICSNSYYSIVT